MPLKLRRRKGSANFYLRGTVRGVAVDETTGTDRRDVADAIRIKREGELLERSVHGPGQGRTGPAVTVLEAAIAYLQAAPRSKQTKRYVNRLGEHFGATALAALSQESIDEAARTLYPDATPETRNRQAYTPLAAILRAAGVALPLRRPKQRKPRNRFVPQERAALLLAAADTPAQAHERALLALLFYTGCRISEALAIAWEQVDFARRSVTFDLGKTDEDRDAPMHELVLEALANLPWRPAEEKRRERFGPVFPWPNRWAAYKALAPIAGAAGVKFTPHMARHSFATWLRQAGHDLRLVQDAGRWKDIKSVARYAYVAPAEVRTAVTGLPVVKVKAARARRARKTGGKRS